MGRPASSCSELVAAKSGAEGQRASGDVWSVCDIAPNPLALGPQNFVLSGCRLRECSAAGSRHLLHLGPVRVSSQADKMEDDTTIVRSKSIPVRKDELPVAHDKHVRGIGKPRHACLDHGLPAHGNVSRTDVTVCSGIKKNKSSVTSMCYLAEQVSNRISVAPLAERFAIRWFISRVGCTIHLSVQNVVSWSQAARAKLAPIEVCFSATSVKDLRRMCMRPPMLPEMSPVPHVPHHPQHIAI